MINLILAIRSLDIGGAERQFIELVKGIDKSRFNILVVTMYGGIQEDTIKSIEGIKYINLKKNSRYDFIKFYLNYKKVIKEFEADVIYSFLAEMNLFSYWCKPKSTKLIWGFRASNMDLSKYGRVSQILFTLQKYYSKRVDKIIANSNESISYHQKEGFFMNNSIVIPNGIDTNRFKPDINYKNKFIDEFKLSDSDIVIGIAARVDAMKGYIVLAKSALEVMKKNSRVKLFIVGDGDRDIKQSVKDILKEVEDRVYWLGFRRDMEYIYNGFDISVSSSLTESFSNSIAEAMSCGVSCVVTDVGDSKIIVKDTGVVVEPNSTKSIYEGIVKLLNNDYKSLGQKARDRIVDNFSIDIMINSSEKEIIKCVE